MLNPLDWLPPTWTRFMIEPSHEIMALFVLRKLILQMRMRSHLLGLDVWFLVGPIVYFHTSCVQTAKALARLRGCAGSPEPSLVAYVISTIISWAGSFHPSMTWLILWKYCKIPNYSDTGKIAVIILKCVYHNLMSWLNCLLVRGFTAQSILLRSCGASQLTYSHWEA